MEQIITEVFSQYAYTPWLVYGAICAFMLMSAVGLPIPEEVVLISAGFLGYMALNPDQYPPPADGAASVNVYVLAAISFFAVMSADFVIYWLGKKFGPRLFKMPFFARMVSEEALGKIERWTQKYGYWAVFIFRFTPGVRFPGHLMCGAMKLSPWKFIAVDIIAAGISVPTQVLLVSFYGEYILQYFTKFKIVFFSVLGLALLAFFVWKWLEKRKSNATSTGDGGGTSAAHHLDEPQGEVTNKTGKRA